MSSMNVGYLEEVGSILTQLDDAGKLGPFSGTGPNLEKSVVDRLVDGTNHDTPMETFLRRKFDSKLMLPWTAEIVKRHTTSVAESNFYELEEYISGIALRDYSIKAKMSQGERAEWCYVLIKYIRHAGLGAAGPVERNRLSKTGTYHILAVCAQVIPWKGTPETDADTVLADLEKWYFDSEHHQLTETEEIAMLGKSVHSLKSDMIGKNNGMSRAETDATRMSAKLTVARTEAWSMLALVLIVNACFGFLYFKRHDWCRKNSLVIMLIAVAGMVALSVRTIVYATSSKETFMASEREEYDQTIPNYFATSASGLAYKEEVSKERTYNASIMNDIIGDKSEEADNIDRRRVAAEHMYSAYRFRERQTFRSSGIFQLALALSLLIILITLATPGTSKKMYISMYAVVLALVTFLYVVMYRIDSHRMRMNWEKMNTRKSLCEMVASGSQYTGMLSAGLYLTIAVVIFSGRDPRVVMSALIAAPISVALVRVPAVVTLLRDNLTLRTVSTILYSILSNAFLTATYKRRPRVAICICFMNAALLTVAITTTDRYDRDRLAKQCQTGLLI